MYIFLPCQFFKKRGSFNTRYLWQEKNPPLPFPEGEGKGGLWHNSHTALPPPRRIRGVRRCSVDYLSRHSTQHNSRNVTEDHKDVDYFFPHREKVGGGLR